MERDIMGDLPEIPPVMPHLTVSDAKAAIAFHRRAFAARETRRMDAKHGKRLPHGALALNGGVVMLSDDFPGFNGGKRRAPGPEGGSGVTIHLNVPDVDAAVAQAVAAGAATLIAPADVFWGQRYGKLRVWPSMVVGRPASYGGAIRNAFDELKIQVSTNPVSFGFRSSALNAPVRHIQLRISCCPLSSTA